MTRVETRSSDDHQGTPLGRMLAGKTLETLQWLEQVERPVFRGLDKIPSERPLLFVGNHLLFGLESPRLLAKLLHDKGIRLRGLGDLRHWKTPAGRHFLDPLGAVPGTPEQCGRLMEAGECILVFPGGAWEVSRGKREQLDLIWRKRMGFARLAVKHGCTIVPFGVVGADEAYDVRWDRGDYLRSPLGPLLKRFKVPEDILMPVVTGVGITPIPRPARFYYSFGDPIETRSLQGQEKEESVVWALRERTRHAVAAEIERMRQFRERDPERTLLPRLRAALRTTSLRLVT